MLDIKSNEIRIVLVLLVLTSVFFWKVVINPGKMIYPASDTVDTVEPMKLLQYQSFQKYGVLPLWNPYETSGNTFVGNILSAMYYPTNMLYLFLYPNYLFGYIFMLDVFLAGTFMYLLMKSLKLDDYSSLLSAVVYMFSGIFIGRINIGHPQVLDILSLMPLLFLLFLKMLENKSWKYAIAAGIVFGLQILAGYLQFAIYSAYALVAYFLFDTFVASKFSLRPLTRRLVLFGIVMLAAFLTSAVQLLPSFELSKYAVHAGSSMNYEFLTSDANSYALTPRYLISFILPDFFGSRMDHTYWATEQFEEVTAYIGILPILLSFFAILYGRNKYVLFFAFLGLISLFFSFGQYNPAFPYLHKIILFFDIVRNPGRLLFLFAFSFSIVSGFGFSTLRQSLDKHGKMLSHLIKVLFICTILAAVTSLSIHALENRILSIGDTQLVLGVQEKLSTPSSDRIGTYVLDYYIKNKSTIINKIYWHILGNSVKLFAILLSATLLLVLRVKYHIDMKYISLALIAIVVIDLWMFGMKYIDVAPIEKIYPYNPVIDFVAKDALNEKFRVVGLNRTLSNRFATRNGIEIIDGFVPISLNYSANYIAAMDNVKLGRADAEPVVREIANPKMLDLLNVKYILSTIKLVDERYNLVSVTNVTSFDIRKQLEFNQTIYLYRNDNMLPRVFVANNYAVLDENKILYELMKPEFDPSTVLLDENPLGHNNTKGEWSATISYYSPNKIVLDVKMTQPGFLVLSEIWYPDWKAFYSNCNNGICSAEKTEAHIYRTDYILRSIYLNNGEYRVEFDYDNLSGLIG